MSGALRCPTCGALDVVVDGVRLARVDAVAPARAPRQVLWSRDFAAAASRTLVVRAVGTSGRPTVVVDAFVARADARLFGARLASGQEIRTRFPLTSPNGRFQAVVQGDGNLVVSERGTRGSFATGTRTGVRLALQLDGNLVLYPRQGPGVFQARTGGNGPSTLVMQNDGNMVLHRDRDGRPTWSSRSGRVNASGA